MKVVILSDTSASLISTSPALVEYDRGERIETRRTLNQRML